MLIIKSLLNLFPSTIPIIVVTLRQPPIGLEYDQQYNSELPR